MSFEFWDIVINPRFLITFTIVVGGFVPLLYSVWKTYLAGKEEGGTDNEHE